MLFILRIVKTIRLFLTMYIKLIISLLSVSKTKNFLVSSLVSDLVIYFKNSVNTYLLSFFATTIVSRVFIILLILKLIMV